MTSKTRTLIIFSPFCSVKKSVLSIFWIHLSVFRNKLYIKIKLIVQAFQIYNYLLTEMIINLTSKNTDNFLAIDMKSPSFQYFEFLSCQYFYPRTLIIFSPFCCEGISKTLRYLLSVLSIFWIHLSVFRNKLYIKIKLIVH